MMDHTLSASCSHWHKARSPMPGQHSSSFSQAGNSALKSSVSPTPGEALRCEAAEGFACCPPGIAVLLLHPFGKRQERIRLGWWFCCQSLTYCFALLVTQGLLPSSEPLHPFPGGKPSLPIFLAPCQTAAIPCETLAIRYWKYTPMS